MISLTDHQMETFSLLLALCVGNSPVTCEPPSQMPVTQSFDVFFDLHLNRWLSKQSRRWWFEMASHSQWLHCNDVLLFVTQLMTFCRNWVNIMHVNILAYRGCHYNHKCAIFQNIIVIDILAFPVSLTSVESHKTSFIIDKPTLVQVIWCRQAPGHHLDLWWPNSMTPYGIPRDQWVNAMAPWCQGPVSLKISHQIFQLYQLYYCYSPPIRLL